MYLLEDHARTLFPLTTTKVVATKALTEIQQHIAEILDQKTSDAFLVQQRCYASKAGYHLRRTAALDPVAAFFVYDLIYTHRAKLRVKPSATRRSFGYRFGSGRPVAPSISYGEFREAIRGAFPKFKHALAFDISSYFNSIYHHDLTEWFEASIAAGPHMQLGQFLRECNKGRSIDCLPHGFHPCKAIGSAFLYGTFGAVNFADWLLSLFSGPAIGFAELLIVPSRYNGIDATKRESFAIAGIGFVLSTGFWVAFGDFVSALRGCTNDVQQSDRLRPPDSVVSSAPVIRPSPQSER